MSEGTVGVGEREKQRADFFISYAGSDRAWAEWIAWQLEKIGYLLIIQAWDFEPGENLVERMSDALTRADRTIALISRAYLASPYCTDEWTGAFLHDPDGRNRLLQVRIEACELPRLLRTQVHIDLVGLPRQQAQTRLTAQVKRGRRKPTREPAFPSRLDRRAEPRFPGQGPDITNVPPRNPLFSGRGPMLRRLYRVLRAESVAAVVQPAAVHGLGGVGKTQLALEYAHRYASDYEIVWWIPAELTVAIPGSLSSLARRLGIPELTDQAELLATLWDELRQRDRWLLIYDNAVGPRDLAPYRPPSGNGVVLVTSRSPSWGTVTSLRLDVFARDDAVTFLRRRTRSSDKVTLAALAETLGNLPLALEQAAAYMDETKTIPADYLKLFREHGAELLAIGEPTTTEKTVATTWQVALERIRIMAPTAQELLSLCAFLAPDDISRSLLSDNAGALPESLSRAVGQPLTYNAMVSVVGRYSLITVTPEALVVHRLVQTVIRASLSKEESYKWIRAAIQLVSAVFPRGSSNVETWPICTPLLPHALAVVDHAERIGVELETTARLLNAVAVYLWGRGDLDQAKALHRRSLNLDETRLGPAHLDVASSLNNLGLVLWDLGELAEAKVVHERALAIRESELGSGHPDVASSLNNLGAVLGDLWQLAEAQAAHEQALEIWEVQLGPDHLRVALSLTNLGVVLADHGQLTRARAVYERALTIWALRPSAVHSASAVRHDNFGVDELGDVAGARAARERGLAIRRKAQVGDGSVAPSSNTYDNVWGILGESRDLAVALSLDNMGVVLGGLADLAAARVMQELALSIREARLGRDHADVAWSLSNIGTVLADLGQLAEARVALERALEIREARLGSNHPDVATSLTNLGTVLADLGQLTEARMMLQQALAIRKARLGRDHPATKKSIDNLAIIEGFLVDCR